jgi:FHS family glucose/mannose:H+ symporter-like MFS transporter
MASSAGNSPGRHAHRRTMAVLHPAFALTGILHAIGGPLLPSLASHFHLSDSQSGSLFFAYYGGTSLGALLCGRRHARTLTIGFFALTCACLGVAVTDRTFLQLLFLFLGVGVGMPMSAVSMLVGLEFGDRSAAPLTILNFSWSAGALIAPLFAARILISHSYKSAYLVLAIASACAAIACLMQLDDAQANAPSARQAFTLIDLRFIALFAFLTFLEVGIENTTGSWLATFVLRTTRGGAASAAAISSLYWWGFLASRGLSSLLLLRIRPARLLIFAMISALAAALVLVFLPGIAGRDLAMFVLGAALAPIFPLLLARFFARARHASDSRWVLAVCGFGGSVLPWLTGRISAYTGSLRMALIVIPAALLLMVCLLPLLAAHERTNSKSIDISNLQT